MRGFSLLELLVALSIIVVLGAMFVSSQSGLIAKSRGDVASAQLLRAINLARSEALLRSTVTLCGSSDGVSCSGRWEDGQVLFIDADKLGRVGDVKNILKVFDGFRGAVLHWRSSLKRDYLLVSADGEDGTFWYCASGAKNPAWAIRINQAGRPRLQYPGRSGKIDGLECRLG